MSKAVIRYALSLRDRIKTEQERKPGQRELEAKAEREKKPGRKETEVGKGMEAKTERNGKKRRRDWTGKLKSGTVVKNDRD